MDAATEVMLEQVIQVIRGLMNENRGDFTPYEMRRLLECDVREHAQVSRALSYLGKQGVIRRGNSNRYFIQPAKFIELFT